MRAQLDLVLNHPETAAGRYVAFAVQILIVFSLVTFSIETLPDLAASTREVLSVIETVTVLIFTIEYLLRVYAAPGRLAFVFSFFGLIDLAAILPFYLTTGVDLRSVRAFRMLRLVRILKLARYSAAVRRFHVAFQIAKEEIFLFLLTALILLYLSAVGIYYFENEAQPQAFASVFHSMWWAISTMTTVGYGDIYPITLGGKCFTASMLILGLGVVSVPAGLLASALSKARDLER